MDSKRSGYCEVPGTSLYYEISGNGIPIIFLHGNPSDISAWDGQIEWFEKKHKTIRYDLRGFGKSKPSSVPYSHAEDLKLLLEYLGIDSAYLVGWSMGGGAVINFTISYPEQVKGIVLADSSLGGFPYSEEFKSSYAVFDGTVAKEKGLDAAYEELLKHPLFAQVMRSPESAKKMRASVHTYSGWHWFNKDAGIPLNPSAFHRLKEIKTPTLIAYGELDLPDFIAISKTLSKGIASSKVLSFKNVGHCPLLEVPELFNKAVSEFIHNIEIAR